MIILFEKSKLITIDNTLIIGMFIFSVCRYLGKDMNLIVYLTLLNLQKHFASKKHFYTEIYLKLINLFFKDFFSISEFTKIGSKDKDSK